MKKAVTFHLNYFRFLVCGEKSLDGEGFIGAFPLIIVIFILKIL